MGPMVRPHGPGHCLSLPIRFQGRQSLHRCSRTHDCCTRKCRRSPPSGIHCQHPSLGSLDHIRHNGPSPLRQLDTRRRGFQSNGRPWYSPGPLQERSHIPHKTRVTATGILVCLLLRQVSILITSPTSFILTLHADLLHLSKRAPSPSRMKQQTWLSPSTARPCRQNTRPPSRTSSSNHSILPLIYSRFAKFSQSGTWICSSPDANPGQILTNTSGSSTTG